jgi:hypothetical protein
LLAVRVTKFQADCPVIAGTVKACGHTLNTLDGSPFTKLDRANPRRNTLDTASKVARSALLVLDTHAFHSSCPNDAHHGKAAH